MIEKSGLPSLVQTASLWVITGLLILTPFLVLPIYNNFILTTKTLLLIGGTLAILALWLIRSWYQQVIQLSLPAFASGLTLFMLATLASTFLTDRYPVANLLGAGGLYTATILLALIGGSLLPRGKSYLFINSLGLGAAILAVTMLLQSVGWGPSTWFTQMLGVPLPPDQTLNLSGSSFIASHVFVVALVALLSWSIITKKWSPVVISTVPLIILGLVLSIWTSLPGKIGYPNLVPWSANWSVALDMLRSPRSALIGNGPSHFDTAFIQFQPASLNTLNKTFDVSQGRNTPLTLLVTTGVLGLAGWGMSSFQITREIKKSWRRAEDHSSAKPFTLVVLVCLILQLLWPTSIVLLIIEAVALAFWIAEEPHRQLRLQTLSLSLSNQPPHTHLPPNPPANTSSLPITRFMSGLGLLGVAVLAYLTGRATMAYYVQFQSFLSLRENDVSRSYQQQQQAIAYNPYLEELHQQYASTNVQIAQALSQKTDITEQEQQQVIQLVQQAIREARAATLLNPGNSANWLLQARIYRNLIGVANDADQWTITAYAQAITTAPSDPQLRVEVGGIFLSQNQFNQALSFFNQATQLKPNYPNALYNTAFTLVQLKQYDQALAAYQQTLALLAPDSEQYGQVQKELEEVQKLAAAQKPATPPAPGAAGSAAPASASAKPSDLSILNEQLTTPQVDSGAKSEVELPANNQDSTTENTNTVLDSSDLQ